MITAELIAAPPVVAPQAGPLSRASRGALLLLFGVIYAGGLEFFLPFSPLLLYGTYVVIIGCVFICLFFDWSVSRNARSVAPYLIWIIGYFLWGMIANSTEPRVSIEAVKTYIKNFLLIGSLAVIVDRRTLKPFAQMVQIAALGNLVLCLWEAANPKLVEMIAQTREEGATAYDVLRPGGLWSNPDEAASAFIFALLMARWAGGALAWMGRAAALVGIYLGASRTGTYTLFFCGLMYAAYWLKTRRIDSLRLAVLLGALLLVGTAAAVTAIQFDFDPSEHWQIARILDFTEGKASAAGGSRLDIAKEAVRTILAGPWYGYGLFTFQFYSWPDVPVILDPPAHNIYLAVWGEAGLFVGITYLFLLGAGVWRAFRTPMLSADRIAVLLMWFSYLIVGLTWHSQFTAFSGMIFICLLWHLPAVLRLCPELQDAGRNGGVE
jgi:O-antigen ligase